MLELGLGLFAIFTLLTFVILRGGFYALEKWFGTGEIVPMRVIINKESVDRTPDPGLSSTPYADRWRALQAESQ